MINTIEMRVLRTIQGEDHLKDGDNAEHPPQKWQNSLEIGLSEEAEE